MRFGRRGLGFALIVGSMVSGSAYGVGSRTIVLDSIEKIAGDELKGVSASSDGVLRTGWSLSKLPVEGTSTIFTAVKVGDELLLGSASDGKLVRLKGDRVLGSLDTKELGVSAITRDKSGRTFVATIPNGKIFELKGGALTLFATLPDSAHVWALAAEPSGKGIYAATGPDGKLYFVSNKGDASVYFDSEETHLISLAVASNGDVLVGSSGKAILYRVHGANRARAVYDFPGEDVRALAISPKGFLFAIVNEYTDSAPTPKFPTGISLAKPSTGASKRAGRGSLYRFDTSDRPERLMKHDEFHYASLALDASGEPYVGTGAEGRIYAVSDAHVVSLVGDTDERQIAAIGFEGAQPWIVSSDPVVYHRGLGKAADSTWMSKPLDCGLTAKFGRVTWSSSQTIEVATRTGNTQVVDTQWSDWAPVGRDGKIASPNGRFVQVRARWRDARAEVDDFAVSFQTENLRAVLNELSVASKSSSLVPTRDGLVASGGETPKHDSAMRISWRADNPDQDSLRYRLWFRREGHKAWRLALGPDEWTTKTEHEWDTLGIAEGRYRIRIEASDDLANPPEAAQVHSLESQPFSVDNTPPAISGLRFAGGKVTGKATDATSAVVRVHVSIDGRLDWRPVRAVDGIFDSETEAFEADVRGLAAGSHVIAIRAVDAAGNVAIADVESF